MHPSLLDIKNVIFSVSLTNIFLDPVGIRNSVRQRTIKVASQRIEHMCAQTELKMQILLYKISNSHTTPKNAIEQAQKTRTYIQLIIVSEISNYSPE